MTHLLDTNAVIDLLSLPPGSTTSIPHDAVTGVSVITVVELQYGIAATTDPRTMLDKVAGLQKVLGTWQPLPVDAAVSVAFLDLARVAIAAGQKPRKRMNDLMIAATALSRGWALVTNDRTLAAAVGPLLPVVPL